MTDLSYFPEKIDSLFFRDICPVFSVKGHRNPVIDVIDMRIKPKGSLGRYR